MPSHGLPHRFQKFDDRGAIIEDETKCNRCTTMSHFVDMSSFKFGALEWMLFFLFSLCSTHRKLDRILSRWGCHKSPPTMIS